MSSNFTVCRDSTPWEDFCLQPPCGQLNPTEEGMYEVLEKIFVDMLNLFNPTTFHMGGDEIHIGCWNSSKSITDWLISQGRKLNEEDFIWMWSKYQNTSFSKLQNASKSSGQAQAPEVVLWNSHLTLEKYIHFLDPSRYAIQFWTNSEDCSDLTIKTVAEAGFKMIFSNHDGAYLDCGYAGWVTDGNNWCSPYRGWQVLVQ